MSRPKRDVSSALHELLDELIRRQYVPISLRGGMHSVAGRIARKHGDTQFIHARVAEVVMDTLESVRQTPLPGVLEETLILVCQREHGLHEQDVRGAIAALAAQGQLVKHIHGGWRRA